METIVIEMEAAEWEAVMRKVVPFVNDDERHATGCVAVSSDGSTRTWWASDGLQLVQLRYDAGADGLAAGESYTRSTSVQIPADATGSRWIFVTADRQLEIAETAETNNTTVGSPAVWVTTRPYPDLQVADVIAPATLPVGDTITVSWTVRNLGAGSTSAAYWFDAVYASTDTVLDGADRKLIEVHNPDFLGAGEQFKQTVDMPVPASPPLLIAGESLHQTTNASPTPATIRTPARCVNAAGPPARFARLTMFPPTRADTAGSCRR